MSAPVISLIITTDTPNAGMVKINASLTSLRDGTVWLDPASPQSGSLSVTTGTFSSYLKLAEITAPGTPSAGAGYLYGNGGKIYWKDSAGTVYDLTGGAYLEGAGEPAVGLGKNGDSYWDTVGLMEYIKLGGTWRQRA
jgi:hypothetical protein